MKPTSKYKSIRDQYSFVIAPILVNVLKTLGQATVLLDDEEFLIIKQSEFAKIEAKAVERERERIAKIVDSLDDGGLTEREGEASGYGQAWIEGFKEAKSQLFQALQKEEKGNYETNTRN